MAATRDGGPAFPATEDHGLRSGDWGMSLRDYYAAKFAAAWLPILDARVETLTSDNPTFVEANRLGLAQADAMIAQRTE